MNTRGQGRIYEQKGSPYWYVAYYAHGKEIRECARHVRTGEKIEVSDKNHREAERFLERRLKELAAEQIAGHSSAHSKSASPLVNCWTASKLITSYGTAGIRK